MSQIASDDVRFSLDATTARVDRFEKAVDDLQIHTRRPDIYPFDCVAGELLAKAFALSRAAIVLIQSGYPEEAFGLCRSLYESAMYLRYITSKAEQRDRRARDFLEFGVTSKAFWFDLLNRSSNLTSEERADIERYKAENRIPDDPKRITQPWSGVRKIIEKVSREPHPADEVNSTEAYRDKERAIAYTDTSAYVHCTQPGVNSYSYDWKEQIQMKRIPVIRTNAAQKACMLIQVQLPSIIRYCLLGMQVISLVDLETTGGKAAAEIVAELRATNPA
ncbi:MAG TPA: DUF5677 domain-containing protein [Acidobacteriaceae bacterium]|jgi:hypothetical protein